jgi:hypothetical protein
MQENQPSIKPISPSCSTESGISFCIITNGKRPEKLDLEIQSILALGIPKVEILLGGVPPEGFHHPQVQVYWMADAARHGRLGEMRNCLCHLARWDHLVVADDDMVFQPDFYTGLQSFGEDYDVLCVRLLNPDGTRYWDWATQGGPTGHHLLDYEESDPFTYVTGGLCVMKANVFKAVQWDELRGFYQGEDLDFSVRLRAAGFRIRFCKCSTVIHDDPTMTQFGDLIIRWQDRLSLRGSPGEVQTRGFYEKSGESCWMSEKGELVLPAELCQVPSVLRFVLTSSDPAYYDRFPFAVALTVEGQLMADLSFPSGNHSLQVVIPIAPRTTDLVLSLGSEGVFVPAELGMNRDQRRLSILLSDLQLSFQE